MKTVITNINTEVLAEIENVYLFLETDTYLEVFACNMPFKVIKQNLDKENDVLEILVDNNPVPFRSKQ